MVALAPFSTWPWESLGNFKYLLYGPFVAKVIHSRLQQEEEDGGSSFDWCFHILIICLLRHFVYQCWTSYSNMLFLSGNRHILKQGVDFKQIDKERDWDNFIILQAMMGALALYVSLPVVEKLAVWEARGLLTIMILHIGVAEPIYYWGHRLFHGSHLFAHYHSLHHSSPIPQPFTAGNGTFLEQLLLAVVIGVPIIGSCLVGYGSLIGIYGYIFIFDFLRCLGHSNVEIVPHQLFHHFPLLRYLIYTPTHLVRAVAYDRDDALAPVGTLNVEIVHWVFGGIHVGPNNSRHLTIQHGTVALFAPHATALHLMPRFSRYHSLHHTEMATNYCLFMPMFDALGNTLNTKSWELQKKISLNSDKNGRVPDFVFLAHVVDVTSGLHAPFIFRDFASRPYSFRLWLLALWPGTFVVMLLMWAKAKVFLSSFYKLRGKLHHTWVVPRFGFQYFLPFAKEGINKQIEEAILKADRMGVKVISLAALNKNEALNGGGTLFIEKHPNLKVRVVHGNTLTAAVILNEIHDDVEEVFLTGATSKLGRAIALYLCRRRVRVLMLTLATERFQKIQKEAPADCQKYLVQVTKYQAARNCKAWIVGKWITPREQSWAPSGTHFHQFVVPPILAFRRDCTYGDLAAMRLPDDVEGLGSCEYTMERGIVHACHAGGVVHSLEGWTHNEVGAIDVERIDVVWEAALKHGLKPVSTCKKTV